MYFTLGYIVQCQGQQVAVFDKPSLHPAAGMTIISRQTKLILVDAVIEPIGKDP